VIALRFPRVSWLIKFDRVLALALATSLVPPIKFAILLHVPASAEPDVPAPTTFRIPLHAIALAIESATIPSSTMPLAFAEIAMEIGLKIRMEIAPFAPSQPELARADLFSMPVYADAFAPTSRLLALLRTRSLILPRRARAETVPIDRSAFAEMESSNQENNATLLTTPTSVALTACGAILLAMMEIPALQEMSALT